MAKGIVESTRAKVEELQAKRADEVAKATADKEKLEAEHATLQAALEDERNGGDYDKYKATEEKVRAVEFKLGSVTKYLDSMEAAPLTTEKEYSDTKSKLGAYSKKLVDDYTKEVEDRLQSLYDYIEEGLAKIDEAYSVTYDYQAIVCKDIEIDYSGHPMNLAAISTPGLFIKDAQEELYKIIDFHRTH